MFTNVPGVPAAPPSTGLVASAVRPDIPRWESGLAWIPERCGTAYQLVPWCESPVTGFMPQHPGAAYYRPVGLRVADQCSTLNGPVDYTRIRRVAEAQTPFAIARELWTGTLSVTDSYPIGIAGTTMTNAHLASTDAITVGVSAASITVGFGRLEQAALEATHGQPVMIHIPVLLLPAVANAHVVRDNNGQLVTHAGNAVIADGGYPGTGPAGQAVGATAWMYATPPVSVLTTDLEVYDNDAWTVDRDVNTRTVCATLLFAATFYPYVHLATEITI